eukprot:jgi/Ulvmu1/9946/UM058_0029.1
MTAPEVFALYRQLIRTARSTFRGDHPALNAAFLEIRGQFMSKSDATDEQIPQLVAEGKEAAAFLKEAVVQAKLNDRGAFEVSNLPDDKVVNLATPDEVKVKKS